MRFELHPEYRDRKALHVDAEAFALIHEGAAVLEEVLPAEVMAELKRPLYHGPAFFGMTVRVAL